MKKLSFYFLATVIVGSITSCAGDGSCSIEGQWKVKSADVTSEKLDKSILDMAKEMMLATTYTFTADSVTIKTGGAGGEFKGTYLVDATGKALSWNTVSGQNSSAFIDNMKIMSCSGKEVTIYKRNPVDTTQAAMTESTLVLERTN